MQLVRSAEVVDLHLESYIPPRLWGYDLRRRHDAHWLRGWLFGHLDVPRALDGGLTGAMWSIATNVLRGSEGRWRALRRNLAGLRETLEAAGGVAVARSAAEYRAARARGDHAALLCVQGGNAYEAAPPGGAFVGPGLEDVVRVTVVHLSTSAFGGTSSPLGFVGRARLTTQGRDFVAQLDAARVFVDLAHVSREGFWDAVDAHDPTLPLIDTHTGVCGVREHWRNLDDAQIRAIADSGGVVGVIFAADFLRSRATPRDGRMVVAHLAHLIDVGGEDVAALGSDYDGFIVPPRDLRDGFAAYFRLTQHMLDAGWSEARIRKVLGENFLRCFAALRG